MWLNQSIYKQLHRISKIVPTIILAHALFFLKLAKSVLPQV